MNLDQLVAALESSPGPSSTPTARQAAVALIFRPGVDLLFIQRSESPQDPWSGHMAFPGGHVDPTDASPRAAVEREVAEELGLDLRGVSCVATLRDVVTPPQLRAMSVTPFAFVLSESRPLRPNHEVAGTHWFSLDRLLSREGRTTFPYRFRGVTVHLPCIELEGTRIWGMTLRMVDDLLERISD